jgi:hypothetical protein
MRRVTVHADARRPTRGSGILRLLESCSQPSSNQNTKGVTKKNVIERKTKTHAHGNTHADGRLTFLAIGQVVLRFNPPPTAILHM